MLSATSPALSLQQWAQHDASKICDITIESLLKQRKYLVLGVPGVNTPFQLTSRQLQCLLLVVKGYSDGLAAEELKISRHTLYEHLRSVMKKAMAKNREQLIEKALAAKIWL
jgi:DNA-binding CsgD family transcriptional regulator